MNFLRCQEGRFQVVASGCPKFMPQIPKALCDTSLEIFVTGPDVPERLVFPICEVGPVTLLTLRGRRVEKMRWHSHGLSTASGPRCQLCGGPAVVRQPANAMCSLPRGLSRCSVI